MTRFKSKLKTMKVLMLFMILSFISFCVYSIFQFENLEISSTESQEEIIIESISKKTENENDQYQDNAVSNTSILSNPFINPLSLGKCHKAILNLDQIEITEAIATQASKCVSFNGVYTREGLDAYVNESCPYEHQSIRSHEAVMQYIKTFHNLSDNGIRGNDTLAYHEWYSQFPIYYMIPKAGSSTTHKVLSWSNKHASLGRVIGERIGWDNRVHGSKCAFTLVRNPIDRLISGYYTINVHLWRFLNGGFFNIYNESIRKPGNVWKFMSVQSEPRRFQTFVSELMSFPNKFTRSGGNEHIISASTILAAWLGTHRHNDLTYIGKVENYPESMYAIMDKCEYFNEKDVRMIEDERRSHEMHGFGWHQPSSWINEFEKYGNWVEWMSLFPILHHWLAVKSVEGVLPPAYYAIDEILYQKIVNYYIQDIVCFGYEDEISFQTFKTRRDSHLNIYEMYKNYSTTTNTTVLPTDK